MPHDDEETVGYKVWRVGTADDTIEESSDCCHEISIARVSRLSYRSSINDKVVFTDRHRFQEKRAQSLWYRDGRFFFGVESEFCGLAGGFASSFSFLCVWWSKETLLSVRRRVRLRTTILLSGNMYLALYMGRFSCVSEVVCVVSLRFSRRWVGRFEICTRG